MRHFILINAFMLMFFITSSAQQAFFSISAAYCRGTHGITHNMFEQSVMDGNNVTMNSKRLYLGEGFNYRADFRFFFDDILGIGLNASLVRGNWQKFSAERKIVFIQRTSQRVRAKGVSVAAAFHVKAGDNIVMPYFSLFPGLFLGSIDLVDTVTYSGQLTTSTWEYPSLSSWFLNFAAGVDFMLTEELLMFLEMEFQNMTVSPSRATLLIRNGSNQLDNVPVNEKEINFLDEITTDYTQQPDPDVPLRVLKPWFPLDNFQIRLGFRILLTRN